MQNTETPRISVVIADDTPMVRVLLHRTLEASGVFSVVGEAGNGREAIERAEVLHPDIVLLDLAMPVMDGLEAIPFIRKDAPETKIVVLSGFKADRIASQALEAGAVAYLEKGSKPDELVAQLFSAYRATRNDRSASSRPEESVAPKSVEGTAKARERFRRAFDAAPFGIAFISPNGTFLEVNARLCQITGYTRQGLLETNLDTVVRQTAESDAEMSMLMDGEISSCRSERVFVRPDKSLLPVIVSSFGVDSDGSGRFIAHILEEVA